MPINGSGGGGSGHVRHEHRASFGDVEQRDAPLMVQLRGDQRTVAVHSLRKVSEAGQVTLVVGRGGHAPVARSRGRRNPHVADEEQRGAAARPSLEVRGLVRAHRAVGVRQVMAHRAHQDAVAELETPDPTRSEEVRERTVAHTFPLSALPRWFARCEPGYPARGRSLTCAGPLGPRSATRFATRRDTRLPTLAHARGSVRCRA